MSAITMDTVRDLIERHSDHISGNTREFYNGAYAEIADELNGLLGSEREKALEELVRDAYWLIVRAVWTHVSQDKFAADWTERVSVLGIEVD